MVNFQTKTPPLQFATERLHVRRYAPHDDRNLFQAAVESVDHIYPFLPWCHPGYQLTEATEWVKHVPGAWNRGEEYNFAIKTKSGDYLGGCGLNSVTEGRANLGYWIRTSAASNGYVTEATIGLIRYGLEQLALQRIEIVMSVRNEASRRVAIKAGGVFEGTLRNRLTLHGENHDAYLYSIIPTDQQPMT